MLAIVDGRPGGPQPEAGAAALHRPPPRRHPAAHPVRPGEGPRAGAHPRRPEDLPRPPRRGDQDDPGGDRHRHGVDRAAEQVRPQRAAGEGDAGPDPRPAHPARARQDRRRVRGGDQDDRLPRESILASDQKVRMLIKDEMDEHRRRSTATSAAPRSPTTEATELSAEDLVPKEEVVVTLTHRGYVKRQPLRAFRAQKRGGVGLKGARPTAGTERPSGTREEDYAAHLLTHAHACVDALLHPERPRLPATRARGPGARAHRPRACRVNNLIEIETERTDHGRVRPAGDGDPKRTTCSW